MTPEQITAIAREYAEEEIATELPNITDYAKERTISAVAGRTENVIRFLLRRYCLVEKSKVKQIYQAKQHILANQNVFGAIVATEASAEKRLMLCLFPEIAKEVEDA